MKRIENLFVSDIFDSIQNIEEFSKNLTKEKFLKDRKTQSAIVRELEIIGEAVKNISEDFRKDYQNIPWKKIAGTRDIIIHSYFRVDLDVVWSIIKDNLPVLKKQIQKIKEDLEKNNSK